MKEYVRINRAENGFVVEVEGENYAETVHIAASLEDAYKIVGEAFTNG